MNKILTDLMMTRTEIPSVVFLEVIALPCVHVQSVTVVMKRDREYIWIHCRLKEFDRF